MSEINVQRVLLSFHIKTHYKDIISYFINNDIEIVASRGTADYIRDLGGNCIVVEDINGNGKLYHWGSKMMHPNILYPILSSSDNKFGKKIGLVLIEPYPLCDILLGKFSCEEKVLRNFDVGGEALAKFAFVNYRNTYLAYGKTSIFHVISLLKNNNGLLKVSDSLESGTKALKYINDTNNKFQEFIEKI